MATDIRARVRQEIEGAVETHIPKLWRARARVYIPLAVDRVTAIVELIRDELAKEHAGPTA